MTYEIHEGVMKFTERLKGIFYFEYYSEKEELQ